MGKTGEKSEAEQTKQEMKQEQKSRTLQELNLLDGFLFYELAGSREYGETFCRIILERILGRPLKKIRVSVEKTLLGMEPEQHGIRIDAEVMEEDGDIYDLEPNLYEMDDPARRSRYYHSLITTRNFEKGEEYRDLREVYVIFILPYDPFGLGRMVYTMKSGCKEVPELPYEDGQYTIFLYTKGKDESGQSLADLLQYMEDSREENATDEVLRILSRMVETVKRDREVGAKYMRMELHDLDVKNAARKEALEEGRQEGRIEGRKAGMRAAAAICRKVGLSEEAAAEQLREEYPELGDQALEYVKKCWENQERQCD